MNNLYEPDNGGNYVEISPRTNYGDGWDDKDYQAISSQATDISVEGSETIENTSLLLGS